MPLATERAAWRALQAHQATLRDRHLRQLFAEDPARGDRFAFEAVGLYFDYSKHRITSETLSLLLRLAHECGLRERTEAMFRGERINLTEHRSVLHVALRAPKGESIVVDGQDVVAEVHAVLERMADFSRRVRGGGRGGGGGRPIRNDRKNGNGR